MDHLPRWNKIEHEWATRFGRLQVARGAWQKPIDHSITMPHHHLELSLLPKGAFGVGCLVDSWGWQRYESVGSLFFLPAHEKIHFRSHAKEQRSIIFEFGGAELESWFEQDVAVNVCKTVNPLNLSNTTVRALLLRLLNELMRPGFGSQVMVESLTAQVTVELLRSFKELETGRTTGALAGWCLRAIEERLADTPEQPSLNELADLCGLSVRHLTRAFRASKGVSLGSYIADYRITQAKRMLATSEPIKVVAYTLGFSAPSNFASAFKRATGQSPSQYRQAVKKNLLSC